MTDKICEVREMKQQEQGFRSNSQATPYIDRKEPICYVHQPVILQMEIRDRPGIEPRYPDSQFYVLVTVSCWLCIFFSFSFILFSKLHFILYFALLHSTKHCH